MDVDVDDTKNLICAVCHSSDFVANDGFYFCIDCGTQSKAVRTVELDIHSASKAVRVKINKKARQSVESTTWECFNYLIHGLVQELISLGAKDELKLTVLQLWSAYLNKSQVAFFDNKRTQLPKLGPYFCERDAKILYNHESSAPKKKKRLSEGYNSEVSGNLSSRQLGKRKRKFAESEYEKESASSFLNSSTTGLSSSTGTTGNAVRLSFTSTARKMLKRKIVKSHLSKHEEDSLKSLDCHTVKLQKKSLPRKIWEEQLNRRTINSILYLALNLIEDDIQLSDMLRYMREGHISTTKIQKFFPENIADDCSKIINNREYKSNRFVELNISIRQRCSALCRFIGVKHLKTPNLLKLACRYCHDLNLPSDISTYCERLMNLCPPKMVLKMESRQIPCYEGRAIAYIIFILKFIFGLDGYRETCISDAANSVNKKLKKLNISNTLFVWNDWVKYIEMRRLILAERHLASSNQSKRNISQKHRIEQIIAENAFSEEDILKNTRINFRNMNQIFAEFYKRTKNSVSEQLSEFHPTLTPHTDYFNIISSNADDSIFIPEFMNENFSENDLHSFLNPLKLKKTLQKYSVNLCISKMEYPIETNYLKEFQSRKTVETNYRDVTVRKLDFNIDETKWIESVKTKRASNEFLVPLKDDEKIPKKKPIKRVKKPLNSKNSKKVKRSSENLEKTNNVENVDLNDIQDILIEAPRRHLENSCIFDNLSDVEDVNNNNEELSENIKFIVSDSKYYTLFGKMVGITNKKFNEIKNKLPLSLVWLLEFCSDYLQIDIEDLYQELLIIENQFLYGLKDLNEMKDILILNDEFKNKDTQRYCEFYRKMW